MLNAGPTCSLQDGAVDLPFSVGKLSKISFNGESSPRCFLQICEVSTFAQMGSYSPRFPSSCSYGPCHDSILRQKKHKTSAGRYIPPSPGFSHHLSSSRPFCGARPRGCQSGCGRGGCQTCAFSHQTSLENSVSPSGRDNREGSKESASWADECKSERGTASRGWIPSGELT